MSTGPDRRGLGVVNTVMENGPADFLNCTVPPSACAQVVPRTYPIAPDNRAIATVALMLAVYVFLCCRIKDTPVITSSFRAFAWVETQSIYPRRIEPWLRSPKARAGRTPFGHL